MILAVQTKLTLRLDDRVVKGAKLYARRTGKSLSQMVGEYFSAVTSPLRIRLDPIVGGPESPRQNPLPASQEGQRQWPGTGSSPCVPRREKTSTSDMRNKLGEFSHTRTLTSLQQEVLR